MRTLAALALLGVALRATAFAADSGSCDRACLESVVNNYLAAMLLHAPPRNAMTAGARYTENTIPLALGQGMWATLSALGPYRIHIDDPEDGQVAYIGSIRENGVAGILALRLKVRGRQITEAEAVVHRNAEDAATLEQRGGPSPLWSEPLPREDRPTHEQLVHATDLYFQGITHGDGNRVPFDPQCIRVLDGTQDTLNPADRSFMFGSLNPSALSCRDNMNTGIWTYIHSIHPRRYEVVDRERGIVLVFARFNHPGNVTVAHVPNVGDVPFPPFIIRPSSLEVAEFFKLRNGDIRLIEGVTFAVPYLQPDGWGQCRDTCRSRAALE